MQKELMKLDQVAESLIKNFDSLIEALKSLQLAYDASPKSMPMADPKGIDRFDICAERILSPFIEGGFSNHPEDNGGPTNRGVTLWTARKAFGAQYTIDDLKNLSEEEAKTIYHLRYWDKINADSLPIGIDMFVFDCAINSGPGQAARWLQRTVAAADDGKIGPKTLAKVDEYLIDHGAEHFIQRLINIRIEFLLKLEDWEHFGEGWRNRIGRVGQWSLKDTAKVDLSL